jgi:hypothetical protein
MVLASDCGGQIGGNRGDPCNLFYTFFTHVDWHHIFVRYLFTEYVTDNSLRLHDTDNVAERLSCDPELEHRIIDSECLCECKLRRHRPVEGAFRRLGECIDWCLPCSQRYCRTRRMMSVRAAPIPKNKPSRAERIV